MDDSEVIEKGVYRKDFHVIDGDKIWLAIKWIVLSLVEKVL